MPTGSPDNLATLRGKVTQFRPGIKSGLVDMFINDRIRSVFEMRTYWSDLIFRGALSTPNAYATGSISVTTGSNVVTGAATYWPVSDAVQSTIPRGIIQPGLQDVMPDSMVGITPDSFLYVDAAGGSPEVVTVVSTTPYTFRANFVYPHNVSCTIWQSSFAGLQLKVGLGSPIFTVTAITSPSTLTTDMNWGAGALTAQSYQILKMYYTLCPNLSKLFYVLDQSQGIWLNITKSIHELNVIDPQRTSTGPPVEFVPFGPNLNGNMTFELWPAQTSSYQLYYQAYLQWPVLVAETDQPPFFMNPNLWVWGALADALRFRAGKDDYYHNPKLAAEYEDRFRLGIIHAMNADSSKLDLELMRDPRRNGLPGPGTQWYSSHDIDVVNWNL